MRRILGLAVIAALVAIPSVTNASHRSCTLTPQAPSCTFDSPGATANVRGYTSSTCSGGARMWVKKLDPNNVEYDETIWQFVSVSPVSSTDFVITPRTVSGLNTGYNGKVYAEIIPGGSNLGGACDAAGNNRVGLVVIGEGQ